MALYDKVTADQKKHKRRYVAYQIEQEFYKKLSVVDFESDVIDLAQTVRDVSQLIGGSVIGTNFAACRDRLGDTVGKHADLAHPLAPEAANNALHLWYQITLQRIERDRCSAEHRILHEHEDENRQQGAALRDRQRESIADEPADRLQLAGHHRNDLASRGAVEMVQRESQHPLIELVAQTAQHSLTDLSFLYVQMQFEPAVYQN